MKYRVSGTVELGIDLLVDADSKEEAIEKAYDEWPGLSDYVGNGKSCGGLCGPSCPNECDANIDSYGEPNFTEASEE